VPVAWVDFEYPWTTLRPASQNLAERYLLAWVAEAAPPQARLLFVLDRGYARVELIQELNAWRQPYLIRGRGKVIIEGLRCGTAVSGSAWVASPIAPECPCATAMCSTTADSRSPST
jgi:hypothetical protein